MEKVERKGSQVEDLDLSDATHCLLCLNDLKYVAIGSCGHKNLCPTCVLRLRLIIKDRTCPICKENLEYIYIVDDMSLDLNDLKQMEPDMIKDKDDGTVMYLNENCKRVSVFPRLNICRIGKCRHKKEFTNVNGLKRHLERDHKRTFCEICLKYRLVFIQEQKTYFINKLHEHIENGDPGDDQCAQILPHPYCNFCDQYFFNEENLQDHLFREHMTCPICGDEYKNWHYQNYPSLERHFDKTHYLCKNKNCLKNLFVAFRTEEELAYHNYMLHQRGGGDKKFQEDRNLLGFTTEDVGKVKGGKRDEEIKFKDAEAVNFGW